MYACRTEAGGLGRVRRTSPTSGHHSEVSQPKRFLQPCLLLLIAEAPAHGYDLLERLASFGFERDPGGLYRTLRSMEREGLVRSEWQLSLTGPGRRCYELNDEGRRRLHDDAESLAETRRILDVYLGRYRAVDGHQRSAIPRGRARKELMGPENLLGGPNLVSSSTGAAPLPAHHQLSQDPVISLDLDWRVTGWNAAAERVLGWQREAVMGEDMVTTVISPRHRELFETVLVAVAGGQGSRLDGHPVDVVARRPDGGELALEVSLSPLWRLGASSGVLAVCRDVSERRAAEHLLAIHESMSAALLAELAPDQLVPRLLEEVCTAMAWPAGAFWPVSDGGSRLRCKSFWRSPSLDGAELEERSLAATYAPGAGLCGKVWVAAEPIWTADLATHSADGAAGREAAALGAGLKSAGAVPVRHGREVVGVLEFFSTSASAPGAAPLSQLEAVGLRLGRYLVASPSAQPRKALYRLDARNTHLAFSCAFMKFMTVHGEFRDFIGWVEVERDDPSTARGECTVKTGSVDTRSLERDFHLCSDDFFAVKRYPDMVYRSTSVEPLDDERFRILGDLTIREVSRPLKLEVRLEDREVDALGGERLTLSGGTVINRLDWAQDWEKSLQAGRWIVGSEVRLELVLTLVRRPG